jgi:hypothetical protein
MQLKDCFQMQLSSGTPVTVGEVTVVPQSRAVTIRFPYGGFVWNRPVTVLVEKNGQTKRLPVIDSTRLFQLGLFGLSFVLFIMVSLIKASQRKE